MSKERLSKQQKNILGCIHTIQQDSGLTIIAKFLIRKLYTVNTKGREDPTRSESASFSRAIMKLWQRDLIKAYSRKTTNGLTRSVMGISLTKQGVSTGKEFASEKKQRNLKRLLKSRFIRRMEIGSGFGELTKMIKELTETVNRDKV